MPPDGPLPPEDGEDTIETRALLDYLDNGIEAAAKRMEALEHAKRRVEFWLAVAVVLLAVLVCVAIVVYARAHDPPAVHRVAAVLHWLRHPSEG